MGSRPTERHARERGEAWDAPDAGPGRYLTFPTFYFQNRTFGLEIHDHRAGQHLARGRVPAREPGHLRRHHIQPVPQHPGHHRARLRLVPELRLQQSGSRAACRSVARSAEGGLHDVLRLELAYRPAPARSRSATRSNWHRRRASSATRWWTAAAAATTRSSSSTWWAWACGRGTASPRTLDSEPLPEETLLGGQASISYNYSEEPMRVFQRMAEQHRHRQHSSVSWRAAGCSTPRSSTASTRSTTPTTRSSRPTSASSARATTSRAVSNAIPTTAAAWPPASRAKLDTMSMLTNGADGRADPTYGYNVQQHAQDPTATPFDVTLQALDKTVRTLPDGKKVELVKPVFAFKGPHARAVLRAPGAAGDRHGSDRGGGRDHHPGPG